VLSAIDQAISGWMAGRYRPDAAAPPVSAEIAALIGRLATENHG
jgi:hypothetical protein